MTAVKTIELGDVMILIIRDKDNVPVTLAELDDDKDIPFDKLYGGRVGPKFIEPLIDKSAGDLIGQLGAMRDGFVRVELVFETDDGFKTVRGVAGTLNNIDVGTFTLTPKGGSGPIVYQINDETIVKTSNTGDLSGLNTEDQTI